jgi:LysM repeat protein
MAVSFSQHDINQRIGRINSYAQTIKYIGQQLAVDSNLISAIIAVESSGNARAGEGRTTGAKGLMQIIKKSWESTIQQFPNLRYRNQRLSEFIDRDLNDAWADPALNILIGTLTLIQKARSLTKMTGIDISADDPADAAMLLTAYNAGEFTVMKAFKRAVAAGSSNPQADFLNRDHLSGAIHDVVTRFNLGWDVQAKYKEISEYAEKVMIFMRLFGGASPLNKPKVAPETTEEVTKTKEHHNKSTAKYQIVHGDTGYRIARKLGVSFAELSRANPSINWSRLSIGQRLNIPQKGNFKEPVDPTPAKPKQPIAYRVKRGETLGVIARKFQVSIGSLKAANPDKLRRWGSVEGFEAGAVIKIPV